MMSTHGIAVSKDVLYDRCGLPRNDDDAFINEEPAGFTLSDVGSKKKALVKTRPGIQIMQRRNGPVSRNWTAWTPPPKNGLGTVSRNPCRRI
jgi:hypothetical protein